MSKTELVKFFTKHGGSSLAADVTEGDKVYDDFADCMDEVMRNLVCERRSEVG